MKHVTIMEYGDHSDLKGKVRKWINSNKKHIKEVLKTEYEQHGEVYLARITYLQNK